MHCIQKMVKKLAFALLVLSLASCGTVNRNVDGPHAKVTSYGVFQAEVIEHASTDTIFRDVDFTTKQRLLQQTTSIPCAIGTRFGVMFDIGNVQKSQFPIKLDVIWKYPMMTTPDGLRSEKDESTWEVVEPNNIYLDWSLEDEFEKVSGTWQISVYHEGRMLFEQSFNLLTCN